MSNNEEQGSSNKEKRADQTPPELTSSNDLDSIEKSGESFSYSRLSFICCILILGAVAVAGWFGQHYYNNVSKQLNLMDSRVIALEAVRGEMYSNKSLLDKLNRSFSEIKREIDQAVANNQSIMTRVEMVAEQIAKYQVDTRSNYVLAEAEYLLKLADQRLLIERNPETALRLIQMAQILLSEIEDGRLLQVREKIAVDIQTLLTVPKIDIYGLQAELIALDSVLDLLSLPIQRLKSNIDGDDLKLASWMDSISNFIRIRKVEEPIAPLVSAADSGRAREILRLCLEQIKFALVREDQLLFDSAVQQAKRLTAYYFDTQSGAGFRVLATLKSIETKKIIRDIPDAATGLRELRDFRNRLTQARIAVGEVTR